MSCWVEIKRVFDSDSCCFRICKILAFYIFLVASLATEPLSTDYESVTIESISENAAFKVTTHGCFHEGYCGEPLVTLYHGLNVKCWEKTLILGAKPRVSNRGEVAIIKYCHNLKREDESLPFYYVEIDFYDSTGNVKGTYSTQNKHETLFHRCEMCEPIHEYHPDADRYFTIVAPASGGNFTLLALSNSGDELWRKDLEKYYCTSIQFNRDRIILDDFSRAALNYENKIYIINDAGDIVFQYSLNLKNPFTPPIVLKDKGELWFYKEKDVIALDPEEGKLTRAVPRSELKTLLFSDDLKKLQFSLYILARETINLPDFSDVEVERLNLLIRNGKSMDGYSSDFLGKELLDKIQDKRSTDNR